MLLRSWRFFLNETASNLTRNRQATVITVLQTLVSLFVLGLFLIIIINTNRLVANFLNNLQVAVFLDDGLDAEQTNALYHTLIEEMPGIKKIDYVSKYDAMKWMKGESRIDFEDMLERNPLPATFRLYVSSPRLAPKLAEDISKLEGVTDVKYGEEHLNRILPVFYFLLGASFILAMVLAGATVFTISNTIRLAIYARRKEIRIMQLVGATDWTIRAPFLLEGIVYGLVGSISAFILVALGYTLIFSSVNKAWLFRPIMVGSGQMAYNMLVLMVVLGLIIGAAGSLISVDRYLEAEYLGPEELAKNEG